jgi:hypothetical protein
MKSQSLSYLAIASTFQVYTSAHPHSASEFQSPKVLVSRNFDERDLYQNWPSYDQLPLDSSYPTKAAWGVWVSPLNTPGSDERPAESIQGADDVQGALNHITNETILAAASEIQLGMALNLK